MKHSSGGYGSGVLKHHGSEHPQAKPTGAPKHLVREDVKGSPPHRGPTAQPGNQGGRSENNPKA